MHSEPAEVPTELSPVITIPEISIVIVTWNGRDIAKECLQSIVGSSYPFSVEVVVVDNASTDGTPNMIVADFPSVILIRNQKNAGFSQANNQGIKVSKGRYVCLINSDVIVPAGCLESMLAYMQQNSDIGLLGPKMLMASGLIGDSTMRLPSAWNAFCRAIALDSF